MKLGFTLVELAIVMVIIGLLIGGILAVQSMIETNKIQTQLRQLQQFDVAISNFYNRYKCIPADCKFEGGNGNGLLTDRSGDTPPLFIHDGEIGFFFTNLIRHGNLNAKLYDPAPVLNPQGNVFHPKATIGNFLIYTTQSHNGDLYYFMGLNRATCFDTISECSATGILTATQALALDIKIDDAKPLAGNVTAASNTANNSFGYTPDGTVFPVKLDATDGNCVNSGPGTYNMARSKEKLCRIQIKSNAVTK